MSEPTKGAASAEAAQDPEQADPPAQLDPASALDDEVGALQRERDELHDRLLRLTAEFDNYRKRIDRERREHADRAAYSVLEELLPVVDDLERALQVEAGPDAAPYRKGVELIVKQVHDLLARRGVTPIDVVGTPFDPHLHQAVAYEPSEGRADGEVIEELRRGYKIGERLLRPAMVKVAKA